MKRLKILLTALVSLLFIGCGGVLIYIWFVTPELDLDQFNYVENSAVYDVNGNFYQTLGANELRESVTMDQIPENLTNAFIAIEDKRFYSHSGVDLIGTGKAILYALFSQSLSGAGGSTITQQLIKQTHLDADERSITRKLKEMNLALQLEGVYSKAEILQAYMNQLYLGAGGIYGVQTGSKEFFDKDVSELDLAQCAILASITNNPDYYCPYTFDESDNVVYLEDGLHVPLSEANKSRATIILTEMRDQGYISSEECDAAILELDQNAGLVHTGKMSEVYSYFTDAVYEQVSQDLMESLDYSQDEVTDLLEGGGLKIYATVDPEVQATLESIVTDDSYYPATSDLATSLSDETHNYIPQSACAIVDNTTGYICALSGGREEKTSSLTLNRATLPYQTGSVTKPLTVYGPALNENKITLASIYCDGPINWDGWTPNNASGSYAGLMSVRTALSQSINTVSAQVLYTLGLDSSKDYAKKLGLTLDASDTQAALALGGYATGQTVSSMAAAYSTFPRGGSYKEATLYTKVVDSTGEVLLDKTVQDTEVFSDTTSYLITQALKDVVNGGTTNVSVYGCETAGKTGTTDQSHYAWFCGYTPNYTMAVWYGYDQPASGESLDIAISGGSYPAYLFEDVMDAISQPVASFTKPSGIVERTIDKTSGMLASDLTALDPRGSQAATEYFASNNVPSQTDSVHKSYTLCTQTGLLKGNGCTDSGKTVVYLDLTKLSVPSALLTNGVDTTALSAYTATPPTQSCTTNHNQTTQSSQTAGTQTSETNQSAGG